MKISIKLLHDGCPWQFKLQLQINQNGTTDDQTRENSRGNKPKNLCSKIYKLFSPREVTLGNFDFESSSDLGLEKGFAMQHEKFVKF